MATIAHAKICIDKCGQCVTVEGNAVVLEGTGCGQGQVVRLRMHTVELDTGLT